MRSVSWRTQLLTGVLPFTAKSHDEMIYQKLHEDALPLEKRRLDTPQALRFAVHRAMHRDKDMRYSTWKAFCDDLAATYAGSSNSERIRFDFGPFWCPHDAFFIGSRAIRCGKLWVKLQ